MRLAVIALLALIGTSCLASQSPEPPRGNCVAPPSPFATDGGEIYLPTYCPMDVLPVAEVHGRLVADSGCLWLENAGNRQLPLWPAGSRVEREGESLVVVNDDGTRAIVGNDVTGGGGVYGVQMLVETIGEEVPAQCRGDDDEHYVLVYEMR